MAEQPNWQAIFLTSEGEEYGREPLPSCESAADERGVPRSINGNVVLASCLGRTLNEGAVVLCDRGVGHFERWAVWSVGATWDDTFSGFYSADVRDAYGIFTQRARRLLLRA